MNGNVRSDPSQLGVRTGDVLAGKYRVDRVLGAGGMGVVVAAHHLQLDERVALKFLLPHATQDAQAVARFIREARAAVKIKSEHVARVGDVGQLENGAPYMVMEYLEGRDLSRWLEERGALPVEQAVDFVLQACVAVADAHALGIVHRDLKPANLFCVRRSDGHLTIKVLDFGISKVTDPGGSGGHVAMTSTSAVMGTPLYMSPEQMRSTRDVDTRTDIWALGAVLHELVGGRPAFVAESVTELAIKVANDPPPPLRLFRPDAPPGLEAVVLRCLEKDRSRRYDHVGLLAVALLPFAPPGAKALVDRISGIIRSAGLSESALAVTAKSEEAVDPRPQVAALTAETLPAVGRTTVGAPEGRRVAVYGAGIAAALAVAVGVTIVVASRRGPVATASAPALAPSPAPAPASASPPTPAPSPAPASAPALAPASPPHPVALTKPPTTAKGPSAAGASTPAGKPAANCDPPYFFDARGNRGFKPECL
jgi:serine/threonine-protein kinase